MEFLDSIGEYFSNETQFWFLVVGTVAGMAFFFVELMIKISEWKKLHAELNPEISQRTASREVVVLFSGFMLLLISVVAALITHSYLLNNNARLEIDNDTLINSNEILIASNADLENELTNLKLSLANSDETARSQDRDAFDTLIEDVESSSDEDLGLNEIYENVLYSYLTFSAGCLNNIKNSGCIAGFQDMVTGYIDLVSEIGYSAGPRDERNCIIYGQISSNELFDQIPTDIAESFNWSWSGCPILANVPNIPDGKVRG